MIPDFIDRHGVPLTWRDWVLGASWVAMIILLKTGYPWWLAVSVLVGVHGIIIYHAGKQKKLVERRQQRKNLGLPKDDWKPMKRPSCKIVGKDALSIIARVRKTLEDAGMPEKAKEFTKRANSAKSHNELLAMAGEYVTQDGDALGED